MKKIVLLLIIALSIVQAQAQWTNGTDIQNTNSGIVSIKQGSNLQVGGIFQSLFPKSNNVLTGEIMGSNGYWGFRTSTDNSFNLDVYNANNPLNVITVNQAGKVGIGTTDFSGSHKLRVEGSIGAREIRVEAPGWSDFVFENDYKLRTLEEVEKHINENGHLPEIPSEAEVAENGINLGEMDAKLLQKIEELTLYLIDLNKRMNQLEQENIELKESNQEFRRNIYSQEQLNHHN